MCKILWGPNLVIFGDFRGWHDKILITYQYADETVYFALS